MSIPTAGWMDGWMEGGREGGRDGGMEGWRDGGMEGWMDGWTDVNAWVDAWVSLGTALDCCRVPPCVSAPKAPRALRSESPEPCTPRPKKRPISKPRDFASLIWVVVRIMVPFWVPIFIRHLLFKVPKKGTIMLTTTHMAMLTTCFSFFSPLTVYGKY